MKLRELRPYQAEAVDYLMSHPSAALFMEMRLGKTLCVIRAMKQLNLAGNILVVAPMVGLWAWQRELQMEGEPFTVLRGNAEKRMQLCSKATWNLINYEGLRATKQILMGPSWSAIILDESRRIANPKAQITKTLQAYKDPDTRRIILSGNPAPEGPEEFFEQMRWLHGRFLGCQNWWAFRFAFFHRFGPFEWVPKPTAIHRIKSAVHQQAFTLTRKEAGIKTEKVYERRTVTLNKQARATYDQIKKTFVAEYKGKKIAFTKWVPVQYMWLQQIASGIMAKTVVERAKFTELVNLLKGELAAEQVVVWFRFNSGLHEAKRCLIGAGITCREIVGSVKPVDRERTINDFRDGRFRVLLCQIKAAKEAIDLSNASTAIYFSNSHSLDERVQSEDRILNPAKEEPLLYVDLVTEDTVDEDIVDCLQDKKREARFFLNKLITRLLHASK